MNQSITNPYVGPRPFKKEEGHLFFGRDRESRDLVSLVVAEQLVLFYAQSGAGKSSLINTRLIPGLEKKNFEILPVGRVSGELPVGMDVDNTFITNLMLSLDQGEDDPHRFANLRLPEFLANLVQKGQNFYYEAPVAALEIEQAELRMGTFEGQFEIPPRALIIDQFEEIFTTHPEAWQQRDDFFRQLNQAMEEDPYLWVILTMREDYIAALDPFAHLLPGGLKARFYMQRMGYDSALEAVKNPVSTIRPFAEGVAEELVNNMRLLATGQKKAGDGEDVHSNEFVIGEFIEPVQLQVVCYQLWENLKERPGKEITQGNLTELAKGEDLAQFINKALAEFYEQAIRRVLEDLSIKDKTNGYIRLTERELRDWFSEKLITEAETRGFVYQGEEATGGLPNEAVRLLEQQFLIRSEAKASGKWYELVHDRFIGPILQANRAWRTANQDPLTLDAEAWLKSNKDLKKLYRGTQLKAAQDYASSKPEKICDLEKEFLETSEKEDQRHRSRRQGYLALLASLLMIIFAGLAFSTSVNAKIAKANEADARLNAGRALTSEADARLNAGRALTSEVEALLNEARAQTSEAEARRDQDVQKQLGGSLSDRIKQLNESISQVELTGTLQSERIAVLEATLASLTPQQTVTPGVTGPTHSPTPTSESQHLTPSPTSSPTLAPTATPTPVAFLQRIIIGKSAGGSQLEVYRLGSGTRHIMLVGGIHAGYSPATVDLARKIINYFQLNPQDIPSYFSLDILISANPDSTSRSGVQGRLNANGVDLNRNWDCNWASTASFLTYKVSGGSAPFSEPETQAMRDYIKLINPVAVVFWEARASGGMVFPGGCGLQSLFSEGLAKSYAEAAGYNLQKFQPYAYTGDATDWLDAQGIPAISVLLPDYTDPDWQNNLKAIRMLFGMFNLKY